MPMKFDYKNSAFYYVRYGNDCFIADGEEVRNMMDFLEKEKMFVLCDVGKNFYSCPFDVSKRLMIQQLYKIKYLELEVD